MPRLAYPDYTNSILNVTGSLLKHYGISSKIPSLPLLDEELRKNPRNIVLWLVDGMGTSTLNRLVGTGRRILEDKKQDITSVFPPTTTAATTSVTTGLPPVSTGWIGWSQYFSEEKKTIILYTDTNFYDENDVCDHPVAGTVIPVESIYSLIQKADPAVKTAEIFPAFRVPENNTPEKLVSAVLGNLKEPGKHFVYAYWDKLDSLEHEFGPSSPEALSMMELVAKGYEYLVSGVPEGTLVIVIADHGQTDVLPIPLRDYPDVWETFEHEPSVDSRAAAFFIRPDRKADFEARFRDHFRDKYLLVPTDEWITTGIFGPGKPHPRFRDFLGDYMAVAIDRFYFLLVPGVPPMKGHHAGLLEEEMMVPLIIHHKKSRP